MHAQPTGLLVGLLAAHDCLSSVYVVWGASCQFCVDLLSSLLVTTSGQDWSLQGLLSTLQFVGHI